MMLIEIQRLENSDFKEIEKEIAEVNNFRRKLKIK